MTFLVQSVSRLWGMQCILIHHIKEINQIQNSRQNAHDSQCSGDFHVSSIPRTFNNIVIRVVPSKTSHSFILKVKIQININI